LAAQAEFGSARAARDRRSTPAIPVVSDESIQMPERRSTSSPCDLPIMLPLFGIRFFA
jgi:hypothetical protein